MGRVYALGFKGSNGVRRAFFILGALTLIVFAGLGYRQVSFWQGNERLYAYGLKVNPNNFVAHMNLGIHFKNNGRYDEAIKHFQDASFTANT